MVPWRLTQVQELDEKSHPIQSTKQSVSALLGAGSLRLLRMNSNY